MRVLCFDISSGGLGRAVFDEELGVHDVAESSWQITNEADGAAVLTADALETALRSVMQTNLSAPVDAIGFSGFMHSSLALDGQHRPLGPVLTWMDRRGGATVEELRTKFGSDFHERTGCRFHPMFPVFKAALFRA